MTPAPSHVTPSPEASAIPLAIVEESTDPMHAPPVVVVPDGGAGEEGLGSPPPPLRRRSPAVQAFLREGLPLAVVWCAFWAALLWGQDLARALRFAP